MTRFLLAQISDLHLVSPGETAWEGFDTAAHTHAAVSTVLALDPPPDLVLVSGDLTNDGLVGSYRQLVTLLEPLAGRLVVLPGNHDVVATLRVELPADWLAGSPGLDGVVEGVPRVVCLDSSRYPEDGGGLDKAQLDWLDATLGQQTVPTVLALHHPPFPVGIDFMDGIALDSVAAEALAEIVLRHPHVELVLGGHVHRLVVRRWAGTVATLAPSVANAVALDLRPGAGAAWNREPPAFLLHEWREGSGFVTHLQHVGEYPATPF